MPWVQILPVLSHLDCGFSRRHSSAMIIHYCSLSWQDRIWFIYTLVHDRINHTLQYASLMSTFIKMHVRFFSCSFVLGTPKCPCGGCLSFKAQIGTLYPVSTTTRSVIQCWAILLLSATSYNSLSLFVFVRGSRKANSRRVFLSQQPCTITRPVPVYIISNYIKLIWCYSWRWYQA